MVAMGDSCDEALMTDCKVRPCKGLCELCCHKTEEWRDLWVCCSQAGPEKCPGKAVPHGHEHGAKPEQGPLAPALTGSAFLFPAVLQVQLPGWNREVAGQEISSMTPLIEGPKGADWFSLGHLKTIKAHYLYPQTSYSGQRGVHLQGLTSG